MIGPWCGLDLQHLMDREFSLHLDGQMRQKGTGSQMRMKPEEMVQYISEYFEVVDGDLIFTGTPAGGQAASAAPEPLAAPFAWTKRMCTQPGTCVTARPMALQPHMHMHSRDGRSACFRL